jgi:two-component system chemotaxis sensor kinase CheA
MTDEEEIIKEFLVESYENLDQLDREFVALESDPTARERISAIFRTIHTIKGTAGFLGFHRLEALTHAAEHLLTRLRDGKLVLNAECTSELLRMVDAVRSMLAQVEAHGNDGDSDPAELVQRLEALSGRSSNGRSLPPSPSRSDASLAPAPVSGPVIVGDPALVSSPAARPRAGAPMQPPGPHISYTPEPGPISVSGGRPLEDSLTPAEPHTSVSDASVRVDVGLLDKLMNLVGELVLARNQILKHASVLRDATFQGTTQRLNIITSELQEGVMKTRMQPIGNIWGKFPRVVRDLALAC